jgi:signal transduction histidine kinase
MKRGLFLKYVTLFVGLVAVVGMINAALHLYFVYQDNRRASIDVQHEKAASAAQTIESFIKEIERQIGWVAYAQFDMLPAEQRRFDYVRLERLVPAITELAHLDRTGHEQLRVSRLSMDVVNSNADRSNEPAFIEAKAHKVYYGPVYFRKGSEPYLTIAVAHGGRGGVTIADVNLKFILDVISSIKIGHAGYAYVVDRQGRLVAHPDISLVLRGTDMSKLAQVEEVLKAPEELAGQSTAVDARNRNGVAVLSAHALIQSLNWIVFVELPAAEAQQPVIDSGLRDLALLALGLLIAGAAGALLARRMVVPIRAMQESAQRIGRGDLGHRMSIRTGDELEALAEQFNRSTGALQESHETLERRVEDRTAELRETLEQQTATTEILHVISQSPTDIEPVMTAVARAAVRFCGAEDAHIFLRDGDEMVSSAHEGPLSAHRLGYRDALDAGNTARAHSIIEARVTHLPDTLGSEAQAAYASIRENSIQHGFRAQLNAPMLRESRAIGCICLRRREAGAFTPRQIELLETFAAQAVIAIENVRLFTEIQEKSRQLETASQHKSQFLANMSHELRTPLNAVLGYTEMMVDGLYGDLPAKAQGVLERVQSNGKHLLGLINDVLDLSKIEAGQLAIALEDYSVPDMIATVMSATESLAKTKGIALVSQLPQGLARGHGDARRLTQVLLNLVGNAIKFTDEGKVEIRARQQGDRFKISVIDTGPGIAKADQAKIFGEFQQVDNTSTRKKGGTGLGLSISRKIVELHGGYITVESDVGKGSNFKITIPINAASAREAAQ